MVVGLAACNHTPSGSFKLEGFVEGAEDSEILILYYDILKDNEWHTIADTTKIINGKFVFEGNIDELTPAYLIFKYYTAVFVDAQMYLEPTAMKLRINRNQPYAYKLSGTKVEKENLELRKAVGPDEKIFIEELIKMDGILKQVFFNMDNNNDPLVIDSLYNLFSDHHKHANAAKFKIYNTIYLDFMLKHSTYQIVPGMLSMSTASADTLKSIYDNLPERSKTSLMGKLALKHIEEKYLENEKDTVVDTVVDTLIGKPAPDFARKDFSGKTVRLSDFKNKNFVLLDFWASWCGPCIAGIPELKKVYDKYSEKGFMIISVSLDTDSNRWLNAVNKYELKAWPQILSMQSDTDKIALMYNVEEIPHFILIDKQGKIMANWRSLGKEQFIEFDNILNKL
jgi:thiol-disulfide isomerase/thioredoxin